jgi:hypothetical protein
VPGNPSATEPEDRLATVQAAPGAGQSGANFAVDNPNTSVRELFSPERLAFDGQGRLYASNFGAEVGNAVGAGQTVTRFNADGSFDRTFINSNTIEGASGLVFTDSALVAVEPTPGPGTPQPTPTARPTAPPDANAPVEGVFASAVLETNQLSSPRSTVRTSATPQPTGTPLFPGVTQDVVADRDRRSRARQAPLQNLLPSRASHLRRCDALRRRRAAMPMEHPLSLIRKAERVLGPPTTSGRRASPISRRQLSSRRCRAISSIRSSRPAHRHRWRRNARAHPIAAASGRNGACRCGIIRAGKRPARRLGQSFGALP